jgi:hypothetical protein
LSFSRPAQILGVRHLALLVVAVMLAGCGSATAAQQADDLHSLAAEGALLAHDRAEADDWPPFTRAHSEELSQAADSLAEDATTNELEVLAQRVADLLRAVGRAPPSAARVLERRLESVASRAQESAE